MPGGRKSLKEEIKIVERLTALSEPTFKYIAACYETGDKPDKKWAVEQMMKLYAKCIPTEITGEGGGPVTIAFDKTFQEIDDSTPEATRHNQEQSQIQDSQSGS